MDLDAYWQENKRFVVSVGAGAVLFLIGIGIEGSIYKDQINAANSAIRQKRTELSKMQFSSSDLSEAQDENAALRAAVARLTSAAQFAPRPEFVPDPEGGSSAPHYLRTFSRVREDLQQRANRASLKLDGSLGMPELSPTVEREILRYLEALDLVETVVDSAIRARADSIDKIQVRLDPGHGSREGVGAIERTRVQMTMIGTSAALTRVLVESQRPGPGGRVLPIDQLEMSAARGRPGQVRLDVTFMIARVKELEPPENAG